MDREEVLNYISSIPYGKVSTYGKIAAACGNPRGSRAVGWILGSLADGGGARAHARKVHSPALFAAKELDEHVRVGKRGTGVNEAKATTGSLQRSESQMIPWWRVVNRQGFLSIRGHFIEDKNMQADLLRKEGVVVSDDFVVDLAQYLF